MGSMRFAGVVALAVVGLIVGGCASMANAPSPEARQVLSPTGKLRVGLVPGTPMSLVKDSATGELKGVGFDLGQEIARRLDVSFVLITFQRNAEILDALKAGQLDLSFQNATPVRMKDMDFTSPYIEIESGFLVPPGSPIATVADLNRPGIRMGATQGSTSFALVSREYKNAVMVGANNRNAAVELVSSRKVDVFASSKATLLEMADRLPGSRILEGSFGVERIAIAIPKGREAGLAYLNSFVVDARAEGLIGSAVARAGARGTKH